MLCCARAQPGDLRKQRSQHPELVQRDQRAPVATLPHQQLPELEVGLAIVGELGPDALQLLHQQIARVAVDGQSPGLRHRVQADQVGGPPGEDLLVVHGHPAVPDLEGVVDRLRAGNAPEQAPGRVLDGAAVDQRVGRSRDLLERDVRVAHQLLDAELAVPVVGVAERRGETALVVEREPIVAPAGRVMQLVAEAPEQVAGRARRRHLAVRQQASLPCLAEAGHLVAHARDPERRLQVAQASFALLQVRLEQPDRPAVTHAALVELLQLVADELLHPPLLQLGDGGPLETFEELRVACHQAPVEQRGADGVVFTREIDALVERARRVPCLEPGIPDGAVQVLGDQVRAGARRTVAAFGQQREEVDVRPRRQLAAAISAGGDQRQRNRFRPGKPRHDGAEQLADHLIRERGDGADHLLAARPARISSRPRASPVRTWVTAASFPISRQ